ncbi:MAG: carbohydrate ABC transporter permease [Lachnospiraceae bacterium]|nr:carbohydrate ABC transporter permease [Lachnospiraceae bacterium]
MRTKSKQKVWKKKKTIGDRISSGFIGIILTIIVIITIYPFWHVLMYSLSDSKASMGGGIFLYPRDFSILSYQLLFQTEQIFVAFGNTLFKTIFGTALSVILTALTAYPLSLPRFKGRGFFSMMIFFTMLFSGGMIPTYLLVKELGLIDNYLVYILPGAMSAYDMFILRNFFQSLPPSLEESAFLDGANAFQIFYKIILPLSKPALAAVTMFYGIGNWNSYMDGVLYVNKSDMQLLQVYLRQLITAAGGKGALGDLSNLGSAAALTEDTMKMTVIAVSVIPVLIVYPFLQKYYTKGVLVGSVKG